MIKVGITGGIASGKSTCAMHLMMKGYEIYSADSINHDLLKHEAKEEVINLFGTGILNYEGEIDRKKLASLVFNNHEALEKLDNILHPLVRKKIEDIILSFKGDIIFFEIPLLFETSMQDLFDYTINVYTSIEKQIERIQQRDNSTVQEAKARIALQMPTDKKNSLASFCLEANDRDEMLDSLDKIIEGILK